MVGGIENEGEPMPRTRKSHPPSLKAKVAIKAIKAQRTTSQIAQMFAVHPMQVGVWKSEALACLPEIFGNGPVNRPARSPSAGNSGRRSLIPIEWQPVSWRSAEGSKCAPELSYVPGWHRCR